MTKGPCYIASMDAFSPFAATLSACADLGLLGTLRVR